MILGPLKAAARASNPGAALLELLWKPVLVLILIACLLGWVHHAGYKSAEADGAKAIADLNVSLGAARAGRDTAIGANKTLADSEDALRKGLATCNAENERLAYEGLAAVQEADQARDKAEQSLAGWRANYLRESKKAPCAKALAALAASCPIGSY